MCYEPRQCQENIIVYETSNYQKMFISTLRALLTCPQDYSLHMFAQRGIKQVINIHNFKAPPQWFINSKQLTSEPTYISNQRSPAETYISKKGKQYTYFMNLANLIKTTSLSCTFDMPKLLTVIQIYPMLDKNQDIVLFDKQKKPSQHYLLYRV